MDKLGGGFQVGRWSAQAGFPPRGLLRLVAGLLGVLQVGEFGAVAPNPGRGLLVELGQEVDGRSCLSSIAGAVRESQPAGR